MKPITQYLDTYRNSWPIKVPSDAMCQPYLTFTDYASYCVWTQEWRKTYRWCAKIIRYQKAQIKAAQKVGDVVDAAKLMVQRRQSRRFAFLLLHLKSCAKRAANRLHQLGLQK